MFREGQVCLGCLTRAFLEGVQNVNTLSELGDVQDPVLETGVNPFSRTLGPTDGIGFQSFGSSPHWTLRN